MFQFNGFFTADTQVTDPTRTRTPSQPLSCSIYLSDEHTLNPAKRKLKCATAAERTVSLN